jgi:hypothetical protein
MIISYILLGLNILILLILIRAIILIPKLKDMAEQMATEIINRKIKEYWDHRDDFKAPIMQFIQDMAKDISGKQGMTGQVTGIMAGNMEIPLGFIPKKYQGLAQLALMFFGKNKGGNGGSQGNTKNPWE